MQQKQEELKIISGTFSQEQLHKINMKGKFRDGQLTLTSPVSKLDSITKELEEKAKQ